jgi:hypothetical protein
MSFYTCLDWFKKLVIFICTESEIRRRSQGIVCRLFALLLKNKYIFQYHNKTRGSQEPIIAHLVFNLTSKVDRKWGCYT